MSNTLVQPTLQRLSALRDKLLHLHRVLLEIERNVYEQVRGRVSSGELLQLVIHHDQFAWLHRLSELVVQIDQILQADEPISSDDVQSLIVDARTLLTPQQMGNAFNRKYYNALQREPAAVLAHASVTKLLEKN